MHLHNAVTEPSSLDELQSNMCSRSSGDRQACSSQRRLDIEIHFINQTLRQERSIKTCAATYQCSMKSLLLKILQSRFGGCNDLDSFGCQLLMRDNNIGNVRQSIQCSSRTRQFIRAPAINEVAGFLYHLPEVSQDFLWDGVTLVGLHHIAIGAERDIEDRVHV